MHLRTLVSIFIAAIHVSSCCDTGFIVTKKVTPAYWRATFSCPPLNIVGTAFLESYYALIDQIEADSDVKVVVFDSNVPDIWLGHWDIIPNNIPPELTTAVYWGNVTRLANLPVLTVAAIRGLAREGAAEIAAGLDVRFASKEKATFGHVEVGVGLTPAGGGLELLPRLVGRSRALEVVLGADDFDADTAALYGWINRAIPDAQFEHFIDTFARRVAGWDHHAISTAKAIINQRSGFPSVFEWQQSWDAFGAGFAQGSVPQRVQALLQAGWQTSVPFEKNLAQELLKFVGPGPWKP
ncbi:ClpP/crotonase-like domain-containing protein [Xylogone sp. PMI_703]|nr:ClpP/crotonase-like domain-containing protein [Xylogone sp. PMI_703]